MNIVYAAPKNSKWGRKRKVSEICTISCDKSETVQDRMSVTINQ